MPFTYNHMNLDFLFMLANAKFQAKQKNRFMGKSAYSHLLNAQAKRRKAGKTPYYPEKIKL